MFEIFSKTQVTSNNDGPKSLKRTFPNVLMLALEQPLGGEMTIWMWPKRLVSCGGINQWWSNVGNHAASIRGCFNHEDRHFITCCSWFFSTSQTTIIVTSNSTRISHSLKIESGLQKLLQNTSYYIKGLLEVRFKDSYLRSFCLKKYRFSFK